MGKLLGLPREEIIGRPVDDFAPPGIKPQISQLWRALREQGEQEGTLQLVGPDGNPREVEYTAKGNVLPVRHVLVLRDKTAAAERARMPAAFRHGCRTTRSTCWIPRDGLSHGTREQRAFMAIRPMRPSANTYLFLYPGEDTLQVRLQEEFKRAAAEGHMGTEGWQAKKGRVAILGQCHHDGAQR